jgi:hypothetical protein
MTEQEYHFNEGMLHAYDLMDRTISGAIKRNGGATTALQIINVFNEFTSHLHYQKSLTNERLSEWQERVEEEPCEEPQELFTTEIKALTDLLNTFGYVQLKGAN